MLTDCLLFGSRLLMNEKVPSPRINSLVDNPRGVECSRLREDEHLTWPIGRECVAAEAVLAAGVSHRCDTARAALPRKIAILIAI